MSNYIWDILIDFSRQLIYARVSVKTYYIIVKKYLFSAIINGTNRSLINDGSALKATHLCQNNFSKRSKHFAIYRHLKEF